MHGVTSSCVTYRIRLATDPERRERALATFRSLVGQVRGETGCVSCHLLEDVHEPGVLTFTAKWRSQRDLERYVRSVGFQRLLAGIDLASEEPEVEVQTTEGKQGLEYFKALLEPPSAENREGNRLAGRQRKGEKKR